MNNKQYFELTKRVSKLSGKLKKHRFSALKWESLINRMYATPIVVEKQRPAFSIFDLRFSFAKAGSLATCVLLAFFMLAPRAPVVTGISGTVKIFSVASNSWKLAEGDNIRLARNDVVKTFGGGQADIEVKGLYQIRIKDDTEIKLAKLDSRIKPGEIKYVLTKGKAFAYLKKQEHKRYSLTIDTPESAVSALGTNFMVEASAIYGTTRVGVLDGLVKVQGMLTETVPLKDAAVYVNAGEGTIIRKGQRPEAPHRLIDFELMELEELYSIGTKPQVALLISTGKGRTRELLSGTPIYIAADEKHEIAGSMINIATDMSKAIKERNKEKRLDSVSELEKLVDQYPSPKYDIQFLLFIGSCYEYLGVHEKAIAAFQKVLDKYPESPLSSIAQYAIGIIYAEKLNNKPASVNAFKKVLSNYPLSPEAEEIREYFLSTK